ncbi:MULTISPECIES: hypothetical protein [Flavobacterium]|jgi:hypothetical protein|uniref:Band 7 domain-containing protein n=1 Tax=Flavobacterium jumunjinense TaxID=998845 RepID=A0ABV5GNQ3_9FLAO|nr:MULTISPECIES: hypothetical protein [Flavobacterium]
MLTFLGFLFVILAITITFVQPFIRKKHDDLIKNGSKIPPYIGFIAMWDLKLRSALFGFGLFMLLLAESVIFAKEGHQYYILSPTGARSTIMSPGIKFIVPFSKIQEWEKFIDIKCVALDKKGNYKQDVTGIEGIIPNGINVRFIDKVDANVYASVRFEMPSDDIAFIKLVETYRQPSNLINNTLLPTVSEQLKNVTFMYSAEDYVSGSATDYRMTIEDALKNGGFVVKKVEVRDTIYNEVGVDSVLKKKRGIKEINKFIRNEKIFVNGIPKRIPHEINVNKIITAQVIIDDVDLNKAFEDKLKQQRDISAEKIIEIQKVETARAAQQRIVAEGERDKAAERVKQEKMQVNTLIAIETRVKEEESNRQLAEIAVKTAELEARALLIKEKAEADANRLKVNAGLTPQERAQIEKETRIGVAHELSKMQVPTNMIIGGNGGNSTESLLQIKLLDDITKKQK